MVSAGVLGAIAGYATALVTLGVPVGAVMLRTRRDAHKAVRLLTGDEHVEGDGVLPRLRRTEEMAIEHRAAFERHDVEIPNVDGDRVRTDGGERPE